MAFIYFVIGLASMFACSNTASQLYSANEGAARMEVNQVNHLTSHEKIMQGFYQVNDNSYGIPVWLTKPFAVPKWLQGHFLRQSCRTYGDTHLPYENNNQVQHYFDCLPCLVSFYFEDGCIKFYQSNLGTTGDVILDYWYHKNMTESQVFFPTIYSDFNLERVATIGLPAYVASNVDVDDFPKASLMNVKGIPVATTENTLGIAIDLQTVNHTGEYPWKDKNFNQSGNPIAFIAATHEAVDQDGVIWKSAAQVFFTSGSTGYIEVQVYKIVDDTRVVVSKFQYKAFDLSLCTADGYPDVDSKYRYLHSVTVTKNHVLLLQTSTTIDPCDFFIPNYPPIPIPLPLFKTVLKWTPSVQSGFVVIRKSDGLVLNQHAYSPRVFFATHQVNAYEPDDCTVVVDMMIYDDDAAFSHFSYLTHIYNQEDAPKSYFQRFEINLQNWNVRTRDLREGWPYTSIEYPTINTAFRTKEYKWAYFCRDFFYPTGAIEKVNVNTGCTTTWEAGNNFFAMEPIFVQRPGHRDEDDGILLVQGYTSTSHGGKATVVILDAKTMTEITRGSANAPALFGNHNRFFPFKMSH